MAGSWSKRCTKGSSFTFAGQVIVMSVHLAWQQSKQSCQAWTCSWEIVPKGQCTKREMMQCSAQGGKHLDPERLRLCCSSKWRVPSTPGW